LLFSSDYLVLLQPARVRKLQSSIFGCGSDVERSCKTRLGSVEKQSHTQSFHPLDGHQPHLPANMISVVKQCHLSLVLLGISFQPRDTLLNAAAKPGTDFKFIMANKVRDHGRLLRLSCEGNWIA
jgi:hypothetical protein